MPPSVIKTVQVIVYDVISNMAIVCNVKTCRSGDVPAAEVAQTVDLDVVHRYVTENALTVIALAHVLGVSTVIMVTYALHLAPLAA